MGDDALLGGHGTAFRIPLVHVPRVRGILVVFVDNPTPTSPPPLTFSIVHIPIS